MITINTFISVVRISWTVIMLLWRYNEDPLIIMMRTVCLISYHMFAIMYRYRLAQPLLIYIIKLRYTTSY